MEYIRNYLLRLNNIDAYNKILEFFKGPQKDDILSIASCCPKEIRETVSNKLEELFLLYKTDRAIYDNEIRLGQAVIWQEVLFSYEAITSAIDKISMFTLRPDTSNYSLASSDMSKFLSIYSDIQIALSSLEQVLGVDRFLDRVSGSTFDVLEELLSTAKKAIEEKAQKYKDDFQTLWNTTNVNILLRHKLIAPNTNNQICDLSSSNCQQVILFVIDGFGFSQYLWHRGLDANKTNFTFNENIFSWLSRTNLSKENLLGSSFITDTGAGLAQIYLGQCSGETGIIASKVRIKNTATNYINVKSIPSNEFDSTFIYKNSITDLVALEGKQAKVFYCSKYNDPPSGFSKCIFKSAEIMSVLPPERVFSLLMEEVTLGNKDGLQVIYLTGIDNSGHTMGAYSNFERFEHQKIGYLFRNFLIELANGFPEMFDGKRSIIITADHGMFESSKKIVSRTEITDYLYVQGIKRIKLVENNRAMLVYNEGYSNNGTIIQTLQAFFDSKQLQVDIQSIESSTFSSCLKECKEELKPDIIIRFVGEGLFYTNPQSNEHLIHFGGHGGSSVDEVFVPLIEIPLTNVLLEGIQKRFLSRK